MNIVKMNYTSIAMPPNGIVVSRMYDLKKDEKGYYYEVQKEKRYIEIELLKSLFSPVDTTWEEVFAPNKLAKTTLSRKK